VIQKGDRGGEKRLLFEGDGRGFGLRKGKRKRKRKGKGKRVVLQCLSVCGGMKLHLDWSGLRESRQEAARGARRLVTGREVATLSSSSSPSSSIARKMKG